MNKTLIVYYSFTGNSKTIAEYVKEKLNGDLIKLEPKIPFSDDYDEVVEEWQNNDIKKDVEIKPIDVNLDNYSNIVLISCVWWYGISPVMKRFLKEYDLSDKKVITASVNAGWVGHALQDYRKLLPNSNIVGEISLEFGSRENSRHKLKNTYAEINNWIKKLESK